MPITSGFFDSVENDRLYDADQMSNYFDGIVSNGVFENIGDRFLVTAGSGMNVIVGTGRAIINCRWVKNDEAVTVNLDPSNSDTNRLDAIVLRLDKTSRAITLTVKKGTGSAGTPALPEITRNDDVYELYIASALVVAGSSYVSSVTDLRPSSYCGWVTGVIQQVNTADLFLQWQAAYEQQFAAFAAFVQQKEAAFNAWFETLTQELRVDTSITKYQEIVTIDVATTRVDIPIPEYDAETDVLFVYLEGASGTGQPNKGSVVLVEGYDYTIEESTNGYRIHTSSSLVFADTVTFVVLKNVIGKNVIYGSISPSRTIARNASSEGQFVQFEEVQ